MEMFLNLQETELKDENFAISALNCCTTNFGFVHNIMKYVNRPTRLATFIFYL